MIEHAGGAEDDKADGGDDAHTEIKREAVEQDHVMPLSKNKDINFFGSGGGTRTPDTRIMIPLL